MSWRVRPAVRCRVALGIRVARLICACFFRCTYERLYVPEYLADLDARCLRAFTTPSPRRPRSCLSNPGAWQFLAPEYPLDWRIRATQHLDAVFDGPAMKRLVDSISNNGLFASLFTVRVEYHR
jgi:hypothetical protein